METSVPWTRQDMSGRLCVITGASGGIGYVTARELARAGADVVLMCRDPGRGKEACARIERAAPAVRVRLEVCDLASLGEVRAAARRISERHREVDVLVNNAGTAQSPRAVTVDGLERTFAVNHLAPFLLTHLLRPALEAGRARIVNVASAAHRAATLDFDDLQTARGYSMWKAYSRSKLCNILFTAELPRRWVDTRTTANCLHPGVVKTGLGHQSAWWMSVAWRVGGWFMIDADAGARTSIFLATANDVDSTTGCYFDRCRVATPSPAARDPESARRLWDASRALCGGVD
jgi:retinol dehydrogenase 12